ncbi:hypothetical protein GIB67_009476 [Kingdonia uniflora]|uniref:Protein kinase domain-containing protein n=1 Tax=Kingdonia uniflora TaxID=39325 RepID=A0A7J7N395_9MAGN|nr:hypothetical protein GIB67_009476 [Kingdonia uniflora]
MKLGQGEFGIVYKGVLAEENNMEIAVKKFSRENIQGKDNFLAELTIINRLRHKHLVRLVEIDIVYARAFIAYMMGNLFFSNGAISLRVGYLVALTDYDILGASGFDWGMPIMAALYQGIDEVSVLRLGKVKKSITGFCAVLE